jgi:hypothetical protein
MAMSCARVLDYLDYVVGGAFCGPLCSQAPPLIRQGLHVRRGLLRVKCRRAPPRRQLRQRPMTGPLHKPLISNQIDTLPLLPPNLQPGQGRRLRQLQ